MGHHSRGAWDAYYNAKLAHEAGNEREAQKWANKTAEHARALEQLAEEMRVHAEEAGLAADAAEMALEDAKNC